MSWQSTASQVQVRHPTTLPFVILRVVQFFFRVGVVMVTVALLDIQITEKNLCVAWHLKSIRMSVFSRFGDGYTVTLRIGGETPDLEGVSEFIKSLFPTAVLKVFFRFITPSSIVDLIYLYYLTTTRPQLQPTFNLPVYLPSTFSL